jgi:hypothetical protein
MKLEIPDALYKRIKKLEHYEGLSNEEIKEQLETTVEDLLEDYLLDFEAEDKDPQEEED